MTENLESLSQCIPIHESTRKAIIEGRIIIFDSSKLIQMLLFGD